MEPSEPSARLVKGTVHPARFGMCLAAGCQALKQRYGSEHGAMERMRSG